MLSEKVVDSNALSSCSQVAAGFRPVLQPAIEGSAEKGESGFGHMLVLQSNVLADDGKPVGKPVLELGGCFEDIHDELLG